MRMIPAVFRLRASRGVAWCTLSALALACDDATLPHEPDAPANVLIARDVVPTRQHMATLAGVARYWADGYAWAGNATSPAPYVMAAEWAFNIASGRRGSPITGTKVAGTTGQYILTFPGLSAWLGARSTVHVTSENAGGYGIPDDVYCKPVTAYLVQDKIEVRCFRASTGAASNGAFRVLATRNYMDLAFAHAHHPTSTNYSPEAKGSWNPAGPSKVIRHSVGNYEVVFTGLGSQLPVGVSGVVQVNALGTHHRHCKVENWAVSTDVNVWVRCFTPTGQPTDSRFSALFVTPAEHLAYAIGHQPTTASYTPLPTFSSNPSGGAITITRTGVGKYRVTWAGADSEIHGLGNIQVTAWGADDVQCKVNTINGYTYDFADILCFNPSGVPTDARYTVLFGS
jgi:hypothetical protein